MFACACVEKYIEGVFDTATELWSYTDKIAALEGSDESSKGPKSNPEPNYYVDRACTSSFTNIPPLLWHLENASERSNQNRQTQFSRPEQS